MHGLFLPHTRPAARQFLGWILLAGGIAAMVVPFLPGTLLILAGLGLIGEKSAWARRLLTRTRDRVFPRRRRRSVKA